ncbi:MAG: chromosomal replication initiator DnaA [Rhodospirillales bacterium]|nr:chromosomal replication initiator DnaA [Rhodospirillales bacterium]
MSLRQLALPFVHHGALGEADFLDAPSNAAARAWLARPAGWPPGQLALHGPAGLGKTHLLHIWAIRQGATLLDGPGLRFAMPGGPLAIDDADAAPEAALLHMLNAAAEAGHTVLLAARTPPARWPVALADLASRLRAMPAVAIEPAEEELLRALLARLLAERQLAVSEAVQEFLLLRLPRTPAALREAAARLDHLALAAGRSVSRALASAVVAGLGEADAVLDEAGEAHEAGLDDVLMQKDRAPSPAAARLL